MYYRKDIFEDPKMKKAFKAKYGYDLAPPKTWKQFDEIGQFLTDKMSAEGIYGAGFFREPPYTQFMFQERFRNEGGKFFDADTMKATVNSRHRRQGVHRDARREQVHAARRGDNWASWRISRSS